MSRTAQLELPLVLPAQAQKHVTVNEALVRLDAATQLVVRSTRVAVPPEASDEGNGYLVPAGATGAWSGKTGRIAVWSNGGWFFLNPKGGWRLWDQDGAAAHVFDGMRWVPHAISMSVGGAATLGRVAEFEHVFAAGATNTTATMLPANALVLGVTGRVVGALSGPGLTGWRIGVPGSDNRYGSNFGIVGGSHTHGMTSAPVAYYQDTPLLLTAEGGQFTSGLVRLAMHFVELSPPHAV